MNVAQLRARLEEIRARLEELRGLAEERALNDDENTEVDSLIGEFDEKREQLTKLEERESRLSAIQAADLAGDDDQRGGERGDDRRAPNTNVNRRTPEDVHDVDAYRTRASSPDEYRALLGDGAKRVLERSVFPEIGVDNDKQREHIEWMLESVRRGSEHPTEIEERILLTSSREYRQAFGKYLAQTPLTHDEQMLLARAASTSNASGGYAIPFTLDPTVILTSAGAVNPYRELARIVTVTGNNWHGITSGGITASYDAEAAEVSDDTPTIAQPSATVQMARAFVPFSIEIGGDWAGFQAEMASEFADAKNVLEESKFTTGSGTGEPQGIITGATVTVSTAATATLALADAYSLQDNLPARWENGATFLWHKKTGNKLKQLAQALSSGDVGTWVDLGANRPAVFNGDPVYRATTISSQYATSNQKIAVYGQWRQFLIVDRLGMNVELVPHMFATANNLPSGQRGLFCYWRNTSTVLVPDAFRTLKVL